jgi:hypothetical protein
METADILEKAAEVLETRGWCQYTYEAPSGEVCAIGAVRTAVWGAPLLMCVSREIVQEDYSKANGALKALADHVNFQYWPEIGAFWNDAPGRTKEEVIDAFKHAAKDLRNNAKPA